MNNRYTALPLIVLLALVIACGCSSKTTATRRYHLEGTVVSVDKPLHQATINAKEIPGFMAAMTMPYNVPDDAALDTLYANDSITATVVVTDSKSWLQDVQVVKHATAAPHRD